jgi:uncharacterized protein (TIGR02118 family)
MAIKLIALYSKPEDEVAFQHHYETVHAPLVAKVPGLVSVTVNKVKKHLLGENAPYMIVEMAYSDQGSFDRAMASEENKAAGRDVMGFAKGLVSLVIAES